MITNMLYSGPFRDMRLLQEEVNRLAQSTAAPRAVPGPTIAESEKRAASFGPSACRFRLIPTRSTQNWTTVF
jgi:hypothetical protein